MLRRDNNRFGIRFSQAAAHYTCIQLAVCSIFPYHGIAGSMTRVPKVHNVVEIIMCAYQKTSLNGRHNPIMT